VNPVTGDFSIILLSAVATSGLIALFDIVFLRAKRRGAPDPVIVSYARSLFPVLLAVLVFRSFVFEPFRIPSGSMMPGLLDGDFILVSKFSYGLRLPLLNTELVPVGEPRRGDVVVFRAPSNPSVNLIKRLVGLPGDHIVVRNNRVFINGGPVPLKLEGSYSGHYGFAGAELGTERLGGVEHAVMFARELPAADFAGTVPAGRYFFMGDNRNDSEDSRFPRVGFVSRDHLIGHAVRIWMSWRLPGWPDVHRIGMRIR